MIASELESVVEHYPEITGIHPACLAVPSIAPDDKIILEQSIEKDGLRHEILLTKDGLLIDGRNRLIACYKASVEPRFKHVSIDPWQVAYAENIARRHLEMYDKCKFGDAWAAFERQAAKERQLSTLKQNDRGGNISTSGDVFRCPDCNQAYSGGHICGGKSRDKIGQRVGVSGKSIDKYEVIKEYAPPDVKRAIEDKEISFESAYKKAKENKDQQKGIPAEKSIPKVTQATTTIVTAKGVESEIQLPAKVVFNRTNDSVDWASWTWNPVTGCEHGCNFCYAREIANSERMKPYYPNGFEPTFHPYRLDAPRNTAVPSSGIDRDGRVFVCSMADLFGKWVPDNWIRSVFDVCIETPDWEYLFLTKWPARYSQMPLIPNAWYGASVIQQSDVKRIESAMLKIDSDDIVKWISLEPMQGPIAFNDLSWCDLVVIGSQTSTTQPEGFVPSFSPDFDWVVDVVNQCRKFGVPYYLKANLLTNPGMNIPKSGPRRK